MWKFAGAPRKTDLEAALEGVWGSSGGVLGALWGALEVPWGVRATRVAK